MRMRTTTNDNAISEVTRRPILDLIHSIWSGRLDDVDFLSRVYDLDAMPSFDGRFPTASGDIYKHRIMNDDWEDGWVFTDKRFDILRGTDEAFLSFITQTVHPIVRADSGEAARLVAAFNELLKADGWCLTEVSRLSGLPVYGPTRLDQRATAFEEPTGWPKVDGQVQQARLTLREAESEEEYQSVGLLCREALISAAQATYDAEKHLPVDGMRPSDTDARRMIEAVIAVELAGGTNEEARAHAKAALKLAVALQHDRTADFQTAALCSEATLSVVNILAILTGRRATS